MVFSRTFALCLSLIFLSACQADRIGADLQKISTGLSQLDGAINGKQPKMYSPNVQSALFSSLSLKDRLSGHSGEMGAGFDYQYMYFASDGSYAQRQYNRRESTVGTWKVKGSNICLTFINEHCLPARPIGNYADVSYIKIGNASVTLRKGDVHRLADDARGENPYNNLRAKGLLFKNKLAATQHCRNNLGTRQTAFDDFFEGKGILNCTKYRNYADARDNICKEKDKGECFGTILGASDKTKGIDSRKR